MKSKEEVLAVAEEVRARRQNAEELAFVKDAINKIDESLIACAEDKPGAKKAFNALVRRVGRILAKWALIPDSVRAESPLDAAVKDCVLGHSLHDVPTLIDDRTVLELLGGKVADAISNFNGCPVWSWDYGIRAGYKVKITALEAQLEDLRKQEELERCREEHERNTYERRKRILQAWAADGDEIPRETRDETEA